MAKAANHRKTIPKPPSPAERNPFFSSLLGSRVFKFALDDATDDQPACWRGMSIKRLPADSVVLVVEDDALVRLCAAEMLEDAGFSVVEACDADEAWDILQDRSDIAVLFTDIDMPGSMDGVILAARVHAAWPDIRLILTSGRHRLADREVPDHGLFVSKPYNGSQVVEAIGQAA